MSLIENIANNIKVLHKVKSVPTNTSKIGIHLVEGGGVYIVTKDPIDPTLRVVKKIYESSDYYTKGSVDTMLSTQKQLLDDADAILQSQVTDLQQTTATHTAEIQLLDDADANLQSQVTAVQQTTATHTAEIQNIKDEYVANKGYYNSLGTLQAAYPTPDAGDIAYVANVDSTTGYYIYNVVGGAWTASTVEAPPVGVPIADYTLNGGSTKTTSELESEVSVATDWINTVNENLSLPVYDGPNGEAQYSEIIGEWRSGYLIPSTPTSYIRENINGYLELRVVSLDVSAISYVTTNKIDVTGLNMIEVEMENISVGSEANIRTRVVLGTAYNQTWNVGEVILYKTGLFARQKVLIDVSSHTGLYYLHIYVSKTAASSAVIPHLKVYSVNFISKIQSPIDIKNSVNEITPERFQFTMGYGNATSSNLKVIVSESDGLIKFPVSYKIIDRQGRIYTGAGGKTVSAIPTNYDTGDPAETTQGYLIYNKINNEVRVVHHLDWEKISDEWLTLAVVKRTSASITRIGDITLHTNIQWEYEDAPSLDVSKNVVARNTDSESAVDAIIDRRYSSDTGTIVKRFTFLHESDIHGDTKRHSNIIDYLKYKKYIDALITTGDILASDFRNDFSFFENSKNKINQDILPMLGNHDVGNSYLKSLCGTDLECYTRFIQPFEQYGIVANGKNYWYKDYSNYKIRIIALYEYDNEDTDPDDDTRYRILKGLKVFSQAQINWFINTLKDTPSDYHVIILTHLSPYGDYSECEWVNDWTDSTSRYTGGVVNQSCVIGNPIGDIVNAWIKGISINKSYSFSGLASYLTPIVANHDFIDRGEGIFIGYFHGHYHRDALCKLKDYPEQTAIRTVASAAHVETIRRTDINRTQDTKSEDAFNIVSVDTAERVVYIVRVGANTTKFLTDRKMIKYSY